MMIDSEMAISIYEEAMKSSLAKCRTMRIRNRNDKLIFSILGAFLCLIMMILLVSGEIDILAILKGGFIPSNVVKVGIPILIYYRYIVVPIVDYENKSINLTKELNQVIDYNDAIQGILSGNFIPMSLHGYCFENIRQ